MDMMMPDMIDNGEKAWAAVLARDPAADGEFWYSVRTTGVYCRPSCAARAPRRENVAFHASPEAAERAGFRACKRCRPNERDRMAAAVALACRTIETALAEGDAAPTLASLAETAGFSPFHFHRAFVAAMGMTPRAYAAGLRAERVRTALRDSGTVTEALYEAGYGSSGRFYAVAETALGMRPAASRQGGKGETIRHAVVASPLGPLLVAATARGLCAIDFGEDAEQLVAALRQRFPQAAVLAADAAFAAMVGEVAVLMAQPGKASASAHALPLDLRGTAFQIRVWQALRAIPAGQTASYSEIAARIGAPRAVRAVAAACAANTLAVAVPCHRVVRGDGALAGYRWGVARKRALLAREKGGDAC